MRATSVLAALCCGCGLVLSSRAFLAPQRVHPKAFRCCGVRRMEAALYGDFVGTMGGVTQRAWISLSCCSIPSSARAWR